MPDFLQYNERKEIITIEKYREAWKMVYFSRNLYTYTDCEYSW
jgi:hypothetical protein